MKRHAGAGDDAAPRLDRHAGNREAVALADLLDGIYDDLAELLDRGAGWLSIGARVPVTTVA